MRLLHLVPFALALTSTALAADVGKRPGAEQISPDSVGRPIFIQPTIKVWPDGNYIFVVNQGTKDWPGAMDVSATCTPIAPTTTCGPNFPGGKLQKHYDTFPKGYGNAPIKGSGNAQQVEGAGWIAAFMGLPAGTFEITAKAANATSAKTTITIAPEGGGLQVSPVTPVVKPTP